MIDWIAKVADEDAGEKHTGSAQADAAKFQTAERHPKHANEGQRADGVRDGLRFVEFEKPVHAWATRQPIMRAPESNAW